MTNLIRLRAGSALLAAATATLATTMALALTPATAAPAQDDDTELSAASVAWLADYLKIDTTNPPGNETAAVKYLGAILAAEGISYNVAAATPGRANLWATLKGGDEPALLLLHHTDVVEADETFWDEPPFGGTIVDDQIIGRGALDMKSHGILHLATFIALHRAGIPLNRDVIFMATADEEAGSKAGLGWLVRKRPDIFEPVGMALTEGGQGTVVGDRLALGVEITQKVPLWLRLDTTGQAGHGSTPRASSAVSHLVGALANIQTYSFQPRIVPAVDAYFKRLAPNFPGRLGTAFTDINTAIADPAFRRMLHENFVNLHALTQNTCAATVLTGSNKVNVVGATASAELDCRLLPDEDPIQFLALLESVIDDDAVSITPLVSFSPSRSRTETPLFAAIETVMNRHFPGVDVVPTVSAGFTDSHHLRELGINSYGFAPVLIPLSDLAGYHGHNERISVENMERGTDLLLEIVQEVVY